jgi:hypothetical protein
VHWPAAQTGAAPEHCALEVHDVPPSPPPGWHATPFTHVEPAGHVLPLPLHEGTHAPSSQTSPEGHWLEYAQAFDEAVHDPSTHVWFAAHSVLAVHAHGPRVPPQVGPASGGGAGPASVATHWFASHVNPARQSTLVVHPIGWPGDEPGGTQYPALQIVPWGQVAFEVHVVSQPFVVHAVPLAQSDEPVQDGGEGGVTLPQE